MTKKDRNGSSLEEEIVGSIEVHRTGMMKGRLRRNVL